MERSFRNSRTVILLTLAICGACAQATTWDSFWRNRDGVKKFKAESYLGAHQAFLKALENDPMNPEIHLNLALTYQVNEEFDKAEKAYLSALHLLPENSPRRFEALFNLGVAYGKQRKLDEALKSYQAALDLYPESKEVKTNIELLFQGGGGGGKGENKDKDKKDKDSKDQDKNEKDGKDQPKDYQSGKDQKPKPFDSKDLSPQDVKKILDEVKNQEQSIRAEEYERNTKEVPRNKDW